jgi:hypothetical protein
VTPARVLRLALLGWGLGHLALGRRAAGLAWLAGEVLAAAGVVLLSLAYLDTSWYLLPFLAGAAFLALWTTQAALACRAAESAAAEADAPLAGRPSPAAALAWLTLPMLLWGTGFWLVAGSAASPAAVVDRFVGQWAAVLDGSRPWDDGLATSPGALTAVARQALDALRDRCPDCADTQALLGGVRVRLVDGSAGSATAVAELVRYERRASTFLGIFATSELTPVPVVEVLRLELEAEPAPYGGEAWRIAGPVRP